MNKKAIAAEITTLQARRTVITRYIELATADGVMGVVKLYTNELARINERLAEIESLSAPKPEKTPCPHYKTIQRFFAIAKEKGLTTGKAANASIRRALENFFMREIESRSSLTADDWALAGNGVESGEIAW